ncbi:hypothetical protein HanIR_Chr01g0026551 [Helianthus annuus]|nr:hypothetical protein HanIR_Chr01g0026551 [Helianthus annuus]
MVVAAGSLRWFRHWSVALCVCVRERERERERVKKGMEDQLCVMFVEVEEGLVSKLPFFVNE